MSRWRSRLRMWMREQRRRSSLSLPGRCHPGHCHPERSDCFALRSSRAVEGSLHAPSCPYSSSHTDLRALTAVEMPGILRLHHPIRERMGPLRMTRYASFHATLPRFARPDSRGRRPHMVPAGSIFVAGGLLWEHFVFRQGHGCAAHPVAPENLIQDCCVDCVGAGEVHLC
jgi:hypothetical protein